MATDTPNATRLMRQELESSCERRTTARAGGNGSRSLREVWKLMLRVTIAQKLVPRYPASVRLRIFRAARARSDVPELGRVGDIGEPHPCRRRVMTVTVI